MTTFRQYLIRNRACDEAMTWVGDRDAILWRADQMTIWHDTCFTDAQRHNVTALYVTFRRPLHKLPRKSAGTRRAY